MQYSLDISEIKSRADRIGVSLKVLAREACIDVSTAYRAANGGDIRISKVRQLSAALVRHELALLSYLQALHPGANADASEAAE